MMLRDAPELRQPLAKEAMAVLTAVDAGVADHVRIVVRDRQMSVNAVVPGVANNGIDAWDSDTE